jgi:hypothetical protein
MDSQSGFGVDGAEKKRNDRIQQTESHDQGDSDGEGLALLGYTGNQGTHKSGDGQGKRMQSEHSAAGLILKKA